MTATPLDPRHMLLPPAMQVPRGTSRSSSLASLGPTPTRAMIRLITVFTFLAVVLPVDAEDMRIARFDLNRVWDSYQRVKDVVGPVMGKRINVGGPTYTASVEHRKELKSRLDEITDKLKKSPAEGPERKELELQARIAALEFQVDELQRKTQKFEEGQNAQAEFEPQRVEILREIRSMAVSLGEARGYRVIIADNFPSMFPPVIASGPTDDLTEEIVDGLNKKYAATKSK
jgi:Skp family chaperone for outer membrane proteins